MDKNTTRLAAVANAMARAGEEYDGTERRQTERRTAPAPAVPAQQQTDLAKRLLDAANNTDGRFGAISVMKADLIAICCEANRYYSGMLAWKNSAEENPRLAPASVPAQQIGGSIDSPEFRRLLSDQYATEQACSNNGSDMHRDAANDAWEALIAHIDAHVATKVQAAREEALNEVHDLMKGQRRALDVVADEQAYLALSLAMGKVRALRSPAATDAGEQQ
jgi:hypothetical protein